LIGKQQHSLHGKSTMAKIKQIFKRWTQQVDDHGTVLALDPEPPHKGNSD
jgi:hypothetical protein